MTASPERLNMPRLLLIAALALTAFAGWSGPALADDGCTRRNNQWYCYPGAEPGVPYYGPRDRRMRRVDVPDDGCTQRRGQWYCYSGARPGVPFYGPRYGPMHPD